jgi:hypothetical protein
MSADEKAFKAKLTECIGGNKVIDVALVIPILFFTWLVV